MNLQKDEQSKQLQKSHNCHQLRNICKYYWADNSFFPFDSIFPLHNYRVVCGSPQISHLQFVSEECLPIFWTSLYRYSDTHQEIVRCVTVTFFTTASDHTFSFLPLSSLLPLGASYFWSSLFAAYCILIGRTFTNKSPM